MRRFEKLESRLMLTTYQPDIDGDGFVTPVQDVLPIINYLNGEGEYRAEFDVNQDNHVTPVDALIGINLINDGAPQPEPNNAPTAINDEIEIYSGQLGRVFPLENDVDIDDDLLSLLAVSAAENGLVVITDPDSGGVEYIPHEGFSGEDSFAYIVSDGEVETIGHVTVVVLNRAPVVNGESVSVPEGARNFRIDVLANDSDPEGDPLTLALIDTRAEHGTVGWRNNQIEYTPHNGYSGPDSFQYLVMDDSGNRTVGEVIVDVVNTPNRVWRIYVEPGTKVYPHSEEVTLQGIKDGLNRYTMIADVGFEFVEPGQSYDFRIEAAVVYVNGGYYRGQAGGNRIQLASGWVYANTHSCRDAPCDQAFWSTVFWPGGIPQIGKITQHEFGHLIGYGHTGNTDCIMHSNSSGSSHHSRFCQSEINSLQNRYGAVDDEDGSLFD